MPAPRDATRGIFAVHAPGLRARGLVVVPCDGKSPLIKNWNKWTGPPREAVLERFARQFPDANIGVLPGPSRVFVADVDTADQASEVERLLGNTPLHIATSRGRHLYYRDVKGCSGLPGNLRSIGLMVDLKTGHSIVIAPPSRHESGTIYRHVKGGWDALKSLPAPNLDRVLRRLGDEKRTPRFTEGFRAVGLNNLLCRHAAFCDTFDELLDKARTINDEFEPALGDTEVVKTAKSVHQAVLAGKITPQVGRKAVARTMDAEINQLLAMDRNGADALALLMKLRTSHGARHKRGETFVLVADAMARKGTMPRWDWKRIRRAARLLLEGGFIALVRPARGKTPAQYRLGPGS